MRNFKYVLLIVTSFISCKKEKETSVNFSEISSGTNYNLRCIYKHNQNEIFVGGGDDAHGILLLSTDQGSSFKTFNQSFTSRVNGIGFQTQQKVYVVCNNFLLMKSEDRGATWNKIEVTTPVPYQYQTNLYDVKFVNDSVGFICGGEEYSHGIIGRTNDGAAL